MAMDRLDKLSNRQRTSAIVDVVIASAAIVLLGFLIAVLS